MLISEFDMENKINRPPSVWMEARVDGVFDSLRQDKAVLGRSPNLLLPTSTDLLYYLRKFGILRKSLVLRPQRNKLERETSVNG